MDRNVKSENVQYQNFVKVMQAKKENTESMFQFWNRLSGLVAKCNIEALEKTEIENALQVAGFTNGIDDMEMVKLIWEKKMSYAELNKLIKDNQEAKQILQQQQPKVKVKQAPIGQVRKSQKHSKKVKKTCKRCGEDWTPEYMDVCPAKENKCNYCKKSGHLQKVCKKRKKDEGKQQSKSKIRKVDEDNSESSECETESEPESSEEEESSSEDSSDEEQNIKERCARVIFTVKEVKIPMKKNKSGVLIANIKEIKPKDGKSIEFEMTVNGKKITAILDTGSPITIMPKSYRRLIKPKENSELPTDRKFAELNGNEVKIRNVFQLETSLNGVTKEILWWKVKAKTKPIVGMDNFELLGLEIMQNRKDGRQTESEAEKSTNADEKSQKIRCKRGGDERIGQVNERQAGCNDIKETKLDELKGRIYNNFRRLISSRNQKFQK